jgi:rhomboid family GlyGly-CTERM serine protease
MNANYGMCDKNRKRFYRKWDFWFFLILILVFSCPLFWGGDTKRWSLYPQLVKEGEWWRFFTHLFTHVTWYHLLLDSLPFFILYCTLEEKKLSYRLFYVFFSGIGSAFAAIWFSSDIQEFGLRGLSGITYGIMAISALEMIARRGQKKEQKIIGICVLGFLVLMIIWELFTGKFPFEFLLFNMVGKPILVCHAGGVCGAILAYLFLTFSFWKKKRQ